MAAELSDEEMMRYNRQIVLRGFDFDGRSAQGGQRVGRRPADWAAPPRNTSPRRVWAR